MLQAESETNLLWLRGLEAVARGEAALGGAPVQDAAPEALRLLQCALLPLQASLAQGEGAFQLQLLELRRAVLEGMLRLRQAAGEMPRACAELYALPGGAEEGARARLMLATKALRELAARVAHLRRAFFDLDRQSLHALSLLQQAPLLLALLAVRLFPDRPDAPPAGEDTSEPCLLPLHAAMRAHAASIPPSVSPPPSRQLASRGDLRLSQEPSWSRARHLMRYAEVLAAQALPYPRYFFRARPLTRVKVFVISLSLSLHLSHLRSVFSVMGSLPPILLPKLNVFS
jgi:hypothetical protein